MLAALAGLTRIDGLALIPALMLLAFANPVGKRLRALAYSALAIAGPLMYELYLEASTGSWTAWQQANQKGWGLQTDWPWTALESSWRGAFEYRDGAGAYAWSYQLELACTVAAAVLVVVLLWQRSWAQACYCGLVLAGMVFVNTQQGADRGFLICFPLYLVLARAAERRAWIGSAYVWVSAPVAVVLAFLYTAGSWAN